MTDPKANAWPRCGDCGADLIPGHGKDCPAVIEWNRHDRYFRATFVLFAVIAVAVAIFAIARVTSA